MLCQYLGQYLGLLRSVLMYYALPGRNGRLKRFYRPFIQPGDLCFDIGAHVGDRIRAWSHCGARVVAIEPQPLLMQWLQRWYGRIPNVTLLDCALGAAPGTQTMYISRRTPTVSTMSCQWITAVQQDASFAHVQWDTTVSVTVVTLDELIARYGRPAFCKIDVEGYEFDVLRGLSYSLPALSFEYIPAARDIALNCIQRLIQLGNYEYNYSPGETHRWHYPYWFTPDAMIAELTQMLPDAGSGDVYARLRKT